MSDVGGPGGQPLQIDADVASPGPLLLCAYAFDSTAKPNSRTVLSAASLPVAVPGKAPVTMTTEIRDTPGRAAVVRASLTNRGTASAFAFATVPPGRCRFVPDNRPRFGSPAKTVTSRPIRSLYKGNPFQKGRDLRRLTAGGRCPCPSVDRPLRPLRPPVRAGAASSASPDEGEVPTPVSPGRARLVGRDNVAHYNVA